MCALSHQDQTVEVVKCLRCALVYKKGIPSLEGFSSIYDEEYVHYSPDDFARTVSSLKSRLVRVPVRSGRLLDYGCGNGAFVQAAQAVGFAAFGLDPFLPDQQTFVNDYLRSNCFRSDLSAPAVHPALNLDSFDVVTLWATAEHCVNPGLDLAQLAAYLKPGGYLVFNSPDGDSLACRKACERWNMALLPEHLQFFTRKSVAWLAEHTRMELISARNCGSPFPFGLSNPRLEASRTVGQATVMSKGKSDAGRMHPVTFSPSIWFKAYQSFYRLVIIDDRLKLKGGLSNLVRLLQLGDHIEVVLRKS